MRKAAQRNVDNLISSFSGTLLGKLGVTEIEKYLISSSEQAVNQTQDLNGDFTDMADRLATMLKAIPVMGDFLTAGDISATTSVIAGDVWMMREYYDDIRYLCENL